MFAPSSVAGVQTFELHAQHRALNAVHAPIPADVRMMILRFLAMFAQHLHKFCKRRIIGHRATSFAERTEIFSRIKTKRTRDTESARAFAFVFRAMRLARVFQ